MPAAAYLKQELEKAEQRRRRKKDRYGAAAQAGKGPAAESVTRQPEGNEGSREEQMRLSVRGASNESAAKTLRVGKIPAAAGEHLRGLRGENNGSFGTWTHEAGAQDASSSAREELDKATYTVRAGGDRAAFTPAHYASYLRLWGSPRKAVEYYTRYLELKDREKAGGLDPEEQNELDMLERLEQAALEYDDARHFMQEKKAYNQQDMDYAFAQNRHRKDGSRSEMFGTAHEAAGVYQSFFLDGVFGGMKEKYLGSEADGGISEEAVKALQNGRTPETLEGMKQWLDKYLSDCVKNRKRGMTMIMRSILRSDPKHTRNTVMRHLEQLLSNVYFKHVFVINNTDGRMLAADQHMPYALKAVLKDPGSRFTRMIRVILERLLAETV